MKRENRGSKLSRICVISYLLGYHHLSLVPFETIFTTAAVFAQEPIPPDPGRTQMAAKKTVFAHGFSTVPPGSAKDRRLMK